MKQEAATPFTASASGRETPDIETSSEGYARRFAGPVGAWFLERQAHDTLELLAPWPAARVLEVGGGHAQLAPALARHGYKVTVAGSSPECRRRLLKALPAGDCPFVASDLLALPFADQSFDVVVAVRLLAHVRHWPRLLREMCRVARRAVLVDYPDLASFNLVSERLFKAKKAVEKNTRPFQCFRAPDLLHALESLGFGQAMARPQFFWPMALHRGLGRAGLSRGLEGLARGLGLTGVLGSPVILRVDRQGPTPARAAAPAAQASPAAPAASPPPAPHPAPGPELAGDRGPAAILGPPVSAPAPMPAPPDQPAGQEAVGDQGREWALKLFERSVLKQAKYKAISSLLDDTQGLTCLDVGANNGVISYLLRQRGGLWHSADLDPKTVESIRAMVGERVVRLDGPRTPFADGQFDLVVIIDFLEHIEQDSQFVAEIRRILRPGGVLVVNVPNLKPGSLLNRLRHAIGLTDEQHGHLRPGYSAAGLTYLLGPRFNVEVCRTYSKTFSETVDTLLNYLYMVRQAQKDRQVGSSKGIVVDQVDLGRLQKEFKMLSILYPFLLVFAKLDLLLPFNSGYKLIIKARHLPGGAQTQGSAT